MKRRQFFNRLGWLGAMPLAPSFLIGNSNEQVISNQQIIENAEPTKAQKKWMDLGFGMFIHFGINTFYDKEWSEGDLDPTAFNPTAIDTDQWCKVAKKAGMKYVVITTKHHDGFCLWPSKYSDYTVAQTPFKKDILAMLAKSAKKHGLKLGFYYSLWDRYDPYYEKDWWKFMENMKGQLVELLTNYGDLVEIWFDGFWKKQKNGWTKKNKDIDGEAAAIEKNLERDLAFIQAWRVEGAYWWQMDHLYRLIKSHQPDCLVMNNSTTAYPGVPLHPVDIRSGEKYTEVKTDKKIWNWLGNDIYLPLQIETTMSTKGNKRFPSGNWFWHEDDHSVRSKEEIKNLLQVASKMEANLLLNVGISNKGLLRKEDE
ncbi:MAG: alpha-L-fucosidase [Bacteroidota bacterium]